MFGKIRFYTSIAILYPLTIGAMMLLLSPQLLRPQTNVHTAPIQSITDKSPVTKKIIRGIPVRIIIRDREIDLPVDQGGYNPQTKSWILSKTSANYAATTALSNNSSGTTFIYGHGTDDVFGRLGSSPPPLGTLAQVHTDNGHTFNYKLQAIMNLRPSDTAILSEMADGPPGLILQACTGALNEWRTMFKFSYESVL